MPRRGEKQREFPVVEQAAETPRIGVRSVTAQTVRGVRQELRFDPSEFVCSDLAGELAEEWVDFIDASGVGNSRASQYRRAIREFCQHVDGMFGDEAKPASLSKAVPDLGMALSEWERLLPSTRRPGSKTPAHLASSLRTLVARRGQHDARPVDDRLLRIVHGELGLEWGATQEVDEFTRKDKNLIVRTAWGQLTALERRLADGWERAGRGRHPAEHGWTDVDDLLWALAYGGISSAEIAANLPPYRDWPEELMMLVPADSHRLQTRRALLRWLVRLLFPDHVDLHTYRVLLVATTGHGSDEITGLTVDGVEFLPTGVRLTLPKKRAGRLRHRTFGNRSFVEVDGVHSTTVDFADQPRREVGAIVKSLLAVTERARRLAGEPDERVFVTGTVASNYEFKVGPWQSNKPGFQAWLDTNNVRISGKADVRRLRKSTKVEKAIAFGGRIADVANDHHEEVFRGHYAQGTTMRVLSGRVITTSQDHWLGKALEGPTVLTASTDVLEEPEQVEALGLTREQADDLRQGALDMGLTQCGDPHNSPYGRPGELCPVAPLRCLECRNAWVLPSDLPQLLLFADHLEALRRRLSPQHFAELWGQSHVNLQAVLAERTEEEKALARKQITAGQASLHLPLSAHVEFES
jgi:hypothetical protein